MAVRGRNEQGSVREGRRGNRYYTTLSRHQKGGGDANLRTREVFGIDYNSRWVRDGRAASQRSETDTWESAAPIRTVEAEGDRAFRETRRLMSGGVLGALRLRALLAAYSRRVLEIDSNEGSLVTVNTRFCYSLGGSLEFGGWAWAVMGGVTLKLKTGTRPDSLISCTSISLQ